MSLSSGVIYAGCWAATLSTALTNLLSVPRLIQALGIDRIYPGLIFFSKGYGKNGEPYRGYVLTFFISLVFLMIGMFICCFGFAKDFALILIVYSQFECDCTIDFKFLSGLVCSHQFLHVPCGVRETIGLETDIQGEFSVSPIVEESSNQQKHHMQFPINIFSVL